MSDIPSADELHALSVEDLAELNHRVKAEIAARLLEALPRIAALLHGLRTSGLGRWDGGTRPPQGG